jgi:uncharacterized RDD family membrane protein YckC
MRCPKCQYISFDNGDRCRNCGYQFSLSAATKDLDLPIQTGKEPEGPLADLALNERLPLFEPKGGHDDRPLVSVPAVPRAPLAVRKPAPAPAAARPAPRRTRADEPELDLELLDLDLPDLPPVTAAEPVRRVEPRVADHELQDDPPADSHTVAPTLSRLGAALVDLVVIGAIDASVLHFTLRICGLQYSELRVLPIAPFAAFLLLLNGGYFAAFTAAGGQSIGKMLTGVKVVPADIDYWTDRVPLGQAVLRSAAYLVSALPAGLGFLPALFGAEKRAIHDRLAHTRVVKA